MAMEMKKSMRSVLVILYCIRFAAADPETSIVWSSCGDSGKSVYRNGDAFQLSLSKVLDSLVRNFNQSGFNTSSVVVEGQNSDITIYGLLQCRGDLDSSDCKQCASTARANLILGCQNTSGFIQLDGCFLRYDNHNFYNDAESMHNTPLHVFCNLGKSSRPQQFTNDVKALVSDLNKKVVQSPKLFAADSVVVSSNLTDTIYSFAQCWRYMSPTSCAACLTFALQNMGLNMGLNIDRCPLGALGGQFGSENCYLRYEVYEFFNTSILSPPSGESPPSSESKRPRVRWIILGVVAATLVLIASIGLWKWNIICACLKRRGREFSNRREFSLMAERLQLNGCLWVQEVAVKRLFMGTRHADDEFLNEANLISRVQHRNLVKLLGCSVEGSERLLVYEYLRNSSLDKILFDETKRHLLDWKERYEIIVGIARGLAYLHEESHVRIIHRDIKAGNILLDDKRKPKIADFGLARFFAEDESHVSTRVAGTLGYMAPEYVLRGQLTEKADVFSFGVLLLEIISGRKNQSSAEGMEFLIEGTWRLYKGERGLEIMDPTLMDSYSWEEGIRMIKIGLLCTQAAAALRPSMLRVVSMLTSETEHLSSPTRPAFVDLDSVGGPHQVEGHRVVNPDQTSSSAATTHSDIHSAAADPSSGTLEPR